MPRIRRPSVRPRSRGTRTATTPASGGSFRVLRRRTNRDRSVLGRVPYGISVPYSGDPAEPSTYVLGYSDSARVYDRVPVLGGYPAVPGYLVNHPGGRFPGAARARPP